MILPISKTRQFQALYNSGTEINLIRYSLVKEHKFILLLKWWKPIIGFLDKYQIKLYSTYKLIVLVTNIYNYTKVVSPQPFQVADFIRYNLIFRYLWLIEVDPKIYFKTGTFKQQNNQELEGRILVINLKYILDNIALGETVYILYLKEYQIQPLFYSNIGIKPNIGNNPSTTDTLQGTTRQAVDLCLRGGDIKDLIEYFQR